LKQVETRSDLGPFYWRIHMLTSALAQVKALSRVAFYLVVAFLVIRLWQDPAGAANSTVNFVGSIGSFFASAVDKISQFVRGLGN
jgi:hypothetical protein